MKRLLLLALLAALLSCRAKPVVLEVVSEPATKVGEPQSVSPLGYGYKLAPVREPDHFYPEVVATTETKSVPELPPYPDDQEYDYRVDMVYVRADDGSLTWFPMWVPTLEFLMANRGDLNDDGDRNILDVLEMVDILLGRRIATYYESRAGDCDGNRVLNILDALNLIARILGRT